jgi:hypothetical protein
MDDRYLFETDYSDPSYDPDLPDEDDGYPDEDDYPN